MTDYPHVPAAFINAIAEEGTKAEAIEYLQKQWNETCALRAELKAIDVAQRPGWREYAALSIVEQAVAELARSGDISGVTTEKMKKLCALSSTERDFPAGATGVGLGGDTQREQNPSALSSTDRLTATDDGPKPACNFCGKSVFGPCTSNAMAAGCVLPPADRGGVA